MSQTYGDSTLLEDQTQALVDWHDEVLAEHDDRFEAMKEVVQRLGAHYTDGRAEVGFWTPELLDADVPDSQVYLEVLTPTEDVDPYGHDSLSFHRERVPLVRNGEFHWGVVEGMKPGTRESLGSLYQLAYEHDGEWHTVPDPVAYSVPFGAYAPAELYDMEKLDEERADRDYFQAFGTDEERIPTSEDAGVPRVDPATSMVEIHPGTATEAGSLGGLARQYEEVGEKLRAGEDLTPGERNFVGYDAIQVMPVEPITENEDIHDFWSVETEDDDAGEIEVSVDRPDMINWGYDIVISAFSATNPAILETGRPDELVDFIATCHNLPEPIRIVFDVALGHSDNGGLKLLNDYYFEGPGMYGQELEYPHPVVRAVLLEMQRRKMDFGADGIRVDGAQDFTNWDPELEESIHDDDYLAEMDAIVQEVAGQEYRPWMIYEDGRPWPREDWELASTYRALIEQHPHSFQWSPITFAHNTPALLTFWATKWWRVREVADFGGNWLTGVANHDTIRRGTQIDPTVEFNQSPVNPYLGDDYPETLDEAYNNPASSMLFHCMLPGVPMDFIHANMRAPWGFVRDTDSVWNVKVVSDESKFLYWQVRDQDFENPAHFQRIKDLGFESRDGLQTFMEALSSTVKATDYDLDVMADMLSAMDQPFGDDLSAADLEAYAYAWMQDVHDFANLQHWHESQDDERTAFDLSVREFRQEREWLLDDLDYDREDFGYVHPTEGTVLYYGLRESPDGDEQVLFAANMEGVPVEVSPAFLREELEVPLATEGWDVELAAPGVDDDGSDDFELANSQAVVWTREL